MMEQIFVADKNIYELEQLFSCEIDDDDYYDVIAYNIARNDPGYFLSVIEGLHGKRRRAAIFGLGFCEERVSALVERLKGESKSNDSLVAAEAVLALIRIGEDSCWKDVQSLLSSNDPVLRSAALRYARYSLQIQAFDVLVHSLSDESFIVRESAVDEMAELGDVRAINFITPLLKDESEQVRQAACAALEELKADP